MIRICRITLDRWPFMDKQQRIGFDLFGAEGGVVKWIGRGEQYTCSAVNLDKRAHVRHR